MPEHSELGSSWFPVPDSVEASWLWPVVTRVLSTSSLDGCPILGEARLSVERLLSIEGTLENRSVSFFGPFFAFFARLRTQ